MTSYSNVRLINRFGTYDFLSIPHQEFLKNITVTKNIVAPTRITTGPAGSFEQKETVIPRIADTTPNREANTLYCPRLLLTFRDAAAGMATRAAVISPPTRFTPNATIIAMLRR
jgi:hypothetical protein